MSQGKSNFAFKPLPPPRFRQSEFPWRICRRRRRPNFEEFKQFGAALRGRRAE
jgi:hypothetical protein